MSWKPQLESKPWHDAVTFYVDLLKKYGPPGSASNSFNEILALFNEGKCGMWIDATIAASFINDPKQSKVADKVAIAVGQQMSAALSGKSTVDAALKASQAAADREMRKGGYYK